MSDDAPKTNGYTLATVYARLDSFQANSEKRQAELRTEMLHQFQSILTKMDSDLKSITADIKDCRERMIRLETRQSPREFHAICPNTPLLNNVAESVVKHKNWHVEEEQREKDKREREEERKSGDGTKIKVALITAVTSFILFIGKLVLDMS